MGIFILGLILDLDFDCRYQKTPRNSAHLRLFWWFGEIINIWILHACNGLLNISFLFKLELNKSKGLVCSFHFIFYNYSFLFYVNDYHFLNNYSLQLFILSNYFVWVKLQQLNWNRCVPELQSQVCLTIMNI